MSTVYAPTGEVVHTKATRTAFDNDDLPLAECRYCDDMGDGGSCTCCGLLHVPRTVVREKTCLGCGEHLGDYEQAFGPPEPAYCGRYPECGRRQDEYRSDSDVTTRTITTRPWWFSG